MRTTTTIALVAVAGLGVATPIALGQADGSTLAQQAGAVVRSLHPTGSAGATDGTGGQATTRAAAPAGLAQGASGEQVTTVQQQLRAAGALHRSATGYFGPVTTQAVKDFQGARGLAVTGVVDRATATALASVPVPTATATATPNAGAATSTAATTGSSAGGLDPRCLTGRVMCVDKTRQRLYWVVDGTVVDSFSTRTGREGMRTREGSFTVFRMEKDSWSHEYRVNMPYAMYFSGGQAVHYSADFAANGYGVGSHGCVNLRDRSGIAWLYQQVHLGDSVVVYRS